MALQFQFMFSEGNTKELLVFDASVTEGHSFSSEITEFPVEEGLNISDNARPKPFMLKLECYISDFPLPSEGRTQVSSGAINQRPKASKKRSENAFATLVRLKDEGIPITVTTGLNTYDSLVIQSIDVPRDKTLRAGLRFSIVMKEVRIVKTETVNIRKARESKGQGKKKDGPKTPETASENLSKKSLGAGLFDSLIGF
jgi:hypothetical protein